VGGLFSNAFSFLSIRGNYDNGGVIKLTLQSQQPLSSTIDLKIEDNFDFLISHFQQYMIFPRRIVATELIDGKKYQHFKIIFSKEQALAHFKKYHYVDCRINAFPFLKEGIAWKPELGFSVQSRKNDKIKEYII
jgi:hypothetical protein